MPRKPRPVHSPAGSFAPCFAPLDEDPSSRSLEGWIADEDEHTQLAQTLEDEGKVVLVLGTPSPATIELLEGTLSESSLLLLPPSTSPLASSSKSVVHLSAAATPSGIGKAFEEALTVSARWRKKGKAKETRKSYLSPGTGEVRRGSVLGLGPSSDQREGTAPPSSASKQLNRLSRPASLLSFSSTTLSGSGGVRPSSSESTRQPPKPASSRLIDVVLHFLPSPPAKDPTNLQTLLSASFLVTTVALPILANNKTSNRDASPPSSLSPQRPRPSSKLANSTSSDSIRRPSESSLRRPTNLFPPPVAMSVSTPSSPVSKTRALSRPASVFSNSEFSLPSEALLVHVLPDNAPPLLPMLLDKFMKPTLAPQAGKVGMIILPESILGLRPTVFREQDGLGDREGDETEEDEDVTLSSPSGSSSSHASSSRQRTPSQHRRELSTSSLYLPPTILSLLLTSSLRPPLVLPRSMLPSSRRGSATSTSSFRSSSLNPSTSPTSSFVASAAGPTFIPSHTAITYLPREAPHPSSSSSLASLKAVDSLGLTMSPSGGGGEGDETPKLDPSGSVSETTDGGGGVGTPRGSVELKDVRVVGDAQQAKLGGKGRGGSGENWFAKVFTGGTWGKKNKAGRCA